MPVTPFHIGPAIVVKALSHLALDALIHPDVRPFGADNPLFVSGSFVMVHVLCVAAGAVGVVIWAARTRIVRPAANPASADAGQG